MRILAIVWFVGAGMVFALILVQTLFGKYAGEEEKAWGWFLPTVVPTLSLMIGVFVTDAREGVTADRRKTDAFVFRLALGLSLAYFLTVIVTVLVQPFTGMTALKLFDLSNLWLGPFQGLVAAALGAFFIGREKNHAADA